MLINVLNLFEKVFNKFRFIKREKTNDVITFAFIIIKTRYDFKHLFLNFKKENEIYFNLYHEYFISELSNRKLSQQRIGFFKMLTKIDFLAYKLQLLFVIRIYSIISIAQLKSSIIIIIKTLNRYKRKINIKSPFIHNENNDFEIKKIINKRITNEKLEYLLK